MMNKHLKAYILSDSKISIRYKTYTGDIFKDPYRIAAEVFNDTHTVWISRATIKDYILNKFSGGLTPDPIFDKTLKYFLDRFFDFDISVVPIYYRLYMRIYFFFTNHLPKWRNW